METLKVKYTPLHIVLALTLSLVLVALSLYFLVIFVISLITGVESSNPFESSIWMNILSLLSVFVFGYLFVYYAALLIKRRPALEISTEGIRENLFTVGIGFIAWKDVAALSMQAQGGKPQIVVVLKNSDDIVARYRAAKKRAWLFLGSKKSDTEILISTTGLDADPTQLYRRMTRFYEDNKGEKPVDLYRN